MTDNKSPNKGSNKGWPANSGEGIWETDCPENVFPLYACAHAFFSSENNPNSIFVFYRHISDHLAVNPLFWCKVTNINGLGKDIERQISSQHSRPNDLLSRLSWGWLSANPGVDPVRVPNLSARLTVKGLHLRAVKALSCEWRCRLADWAALSMLSTKSHRSDQPFLW